MPSTQQQTFIKLIGGFSIVGMFLGGAIILLYYGIESFRSSSESTENQLPEPVAEQKPTPDSQLENTQPNLYESSQKLGARSQEKKSSQKVSEVSNKGTTIQVASQSNDMETNSGSATAAPEAMLVNVNFEAFTPGGAKNFIAESESALEGPAGGLNTRWNQYASVVSSGPLVDSAGTATDLSFTTDFSQGRRGSNTDVLPAFNSTLTYFPRSFQKRNLTIKGLKAGGLYNIWIVAYNNHRLFNNGQERLAGIWSTPNTTTSASSQLLDSSMANSDNSFLEGTNFIKFENIEANSSGMIVFDATSKIRKGANTNDSDPNDFHRIGLSAFQIRGPIGPIGD